ncbi:MAG: galactoside O-acetyltransferase [Clostridia bacterium]|nr:galactoside O-acetyltransferase [Clostridia bacterium]
MNETRIDLREVGKERREQTKRTSDALFKLNHTQPFTDEYDKLVKEFFTGGLGDNCYILTPLYINLVENLHIGNNVSIGPYFKCMSAGNIYIEDDVQIAMNVSVITNNHDFYDRAILTVKDVRIKKNVWIGAGATILAGVTVGENAIVGAGSVVTHDVEPNTVVVGNPARVIKRLDADKFN